MVNGEGLAGSLEGLGDARRVVYCVIPADLAAKLHDPLRRHFRDERDVEVIVERRSGGERRAGEERRVRETEHRGAERRKVHSAAGRRAGERRAEPAAAEPLPLPRRFRRFAERLRFVERVEPSGLRREDLDTARVVARFQAGDREAFSVLYARYFDRVYGYMRVALANHEEAEDATQEVFAQLLAKLRTYERRERPFRSWLFTIVRNRALMELRRRGRLEPTDPQELERMRADPEPGDDAALGVLGWITDPDLAMFVERLPVAQRQVLLLRYVLDMTDTQIAEKLGRTPEDVRQLQYRATTFLRERLTALGRGARDRKPAGIRRVDDQAVVLRARRWSLY